MEIAVAALAALAALVVIGPFLNVVIERVPDRLALRGARSEGEPCDELVVGGLPLQPYLLRRGRCRTGEPLPRAWLGAELLTAALLVVAALEYGDSVAFVPVALLFALLVPACVIDLRVLRIPDRIVFPGLAVAVPAVIIASLIDDHPRAITGALVGALTYFVLLLLPHLVYPRGMGFGDVKLALLLGLVVGWLGWQSDHPVLGPVRLVIYAMVVGLLSGVLFGVLLPMVRRGKAFPLGPGLAIGTVVVTLFASDLRI